MTHIHSKRACRKFVSRHIRKHLKDKYPYRQSIKIALEEAREQGCKV